MKKRIMFLSIAFLLAAVNLFADTAKNMPPIDTKTAAIAGAAILGGFFFLFIFLIVAYIYCAICLYFIAKKTQKEPAWLGWVPIGNLFLMCKIGSVSYLWLLGFLLVFVPFIGTPAVIALSGYIWYKIALARNKPAWIGIITCLPFVGLITMGYLAFSD